MSSRGLINQWTSMVSRTVYGTLEQRPDALDTAGIYGVSRLFFRL